MSNFTAAQDAARTALRNIAIGEARGATSITAYALLAMTDVINGVWEASDAGGIYTARFEWLNAENTALGKELKSVPQGKSLASQVSKFKIALELGEIARDRPEVAEILTTVSTAATVASNYKKTLAAAGKMRAMLAKDPNVSDADLLGEALAATEALEKSPATLVEDFEKIAKAWDKLGDAHPEALAAVKTERPAVVADLHAMLTKFRDVAKFVEARAAMMD